MGAIPLLILPQILFSEVAIPRSSFGGAVAWVERAMPVSWCYDLFVTAAAASPAWSTVALDLLAQAACAAALAGVALLALLPARESR